MQLNRNNKNWKTESKKTKSNQKVNKKKTQIPRIKINDKTTKTQRVQLGTCWARTQATESFLLFCTSIRVPEIENLGLWFGAETVGTKTLGVALNENNPSICFQFLFQWRIETQKIKMATERGLGCYLRNGEQLSVGLVRYDLIFT